MVKGVKKLVSYVFGRKKDDAPPKIEGDADETASSSGRISRKEAKDILRSLMEGGKHQFGEFDKEAAIKKVFARTEEDFIPVAENGGKSVAMDGSGVKMSGKPKTVSCKAKISTTVRQYGINDQVLQHFQNRGFIGWSACAILAQHEIINRACAIPAEDAIAHGYTVKCESPTHKHDADHEKSELPFLEEIKKLSDRMGMNDLCIQLDYKKKVFGIGLAIPRVEGADYEKPYNPDGIAKGSYKGFAIVDPYWLTYELDSDAQDDPTSPDFYEPTYYRMPNGKRVHKSWIIRAVNSHVPDVLKPTYYFGGVPLPQMLYERVFCADKIANEAPLLAMTKRLLIADANVEELIGDDEHASKMLKMIEYFRDNFSIFFKKPNTQVSQIDTTLAEFNQLIMTQYQLVCTIAQMPATKLLKVTPTGFQSTGEYEWKDYAQALLDIRNNVYTPFLERHYELLVRSSYPDRKDIKLSVRFNPIEVPTSAEIATQESRIAQLLNTLIRAGVITPEEARTVLRGEENGMFKGISATMPEALKQPQGGMPGGAPMPPGGGAGSPPPAAGAENPPDGGESQDKSEEYSKIFVDAVRKATEIAGGKSDALEKFGGGGNGGEGEEDKSLASFAGMVKKAVGDSQIAFDEADADLIAAGIVAGIRELRARRQSA